MTQCNLSLWQHMIEVTNSNPELLTRYKTDLAHDFSFLHSENRHEGETLLWVIRESGSHIFSLDRPLEDCKSRLDSVIFPGQQYKIYALTITRLERAWTDQEKEPHGTRQEHSLRTAMDLILALHQQPVEEARA